VFDTPQDRVYLPRRKITNLALLIKSFRVGVYIKAKLWLTLLGLLASTFQVLRWARIKARPLQFYVNSKCNSALPLDKPILVTRHVWNHLQWWLKEENLSLGIPLSLQAYQHVVMTDASGDGWGGTLDEDLRIQGVWNDRMKRWHINRLEFQAVILTLRSFREQVKWQDDSYKVRQCEGLCLHKQGGRHQIVGPMPAGLGTSTLGHGQHCLVAGS
jgi:hypothetical protein